MYKFLENYKPLSIKKIEKIENKLSIKLPNSYKEFISKYNNAEFISSSYFVYKRGKGYLNTNRKKLEDKAISLYKFTDFGKIEKEIYLIDNEFRQINSQEIIPIVNESCSENYFFIYVKEDNNYGKIYFANEMSDFTFDTLHYMAENFEEFLGCIIDDDSYRDRFKLPK